MDKIHHVTFHLTNKCNLMCKHCWLEADSGKGIEMIGLDKLKTVAGEIKDLGINSVKLTGGEPFLYPGIREFISFLGSRQMDITIETNATLLDREDVNLLKENKCYLAVSLDGYIKEYHDWFRQKQGSFEKTLETIEILVSKEVGLQIIWSVCRENVSDIEGMLRLCQKKGIQTIKVNPVNFSGRARTTNSISLLSAEDRIRLHEQIQQLRIKYPDIHIAYPVPPAFMSINEYAVYASECDFCSRCTILCNGEVGLCGADENSSVIYFGNIYLNSMKDIFAGPRRTELCNGIFGNIGGICANCIHMCHCKGYCRANALYVSGKINAPYFLCQEMYEKGKFPLNRMIRQE